MTYYNNTSAVPLPKQEVPWAHIHKDIQWVAFDKDKDFWYGYAIRPEAFEQRWAAHAAGPKGFWNLSCVAGMPPCTGDWRESLIPRPEGV